MNMMREATLQPGSITHVPYTLSSGVYEVHAKSSHLFSVHLVTKDQLQALIRREPARERIGARGYSEHHLCVALESGSWHLVFDNTCKEVLTIRYELRKNGFLSDYCLEFT